MSNECAIGSNTCKAETYCPIQPGDTAPTQCLPCTPTMDSKFSCNCTDSTENKNCSECSESVCKTCNSQYFLSGTNCTKCAKGCDKCSSADQCEVCLSGFKLKGGKCEIFCTKFGECGRAQFCNLGTNECENCAGDCGACISLDVCGRCDDFNQYVDIYGKCQPECTGLKVNEYCKDGVVSACGEGINSPCKCGSKAHCASCNETATECKTCLPGFKFANGSCSNCLDGYLSLGEICIQLTPGPDSGSGNKLSGGAIAGIVIGCLVVVGGVGGGLAYYFTRKGRVGKGKSQKVDSAPEEQIFLSVQ